MCEQFCKGDEKNKYRLKKELKFDMINFNDIDPIIHKQDFMTKEKMLKYLKY